MMSETRNEPINYAGSHRDALAEAQRILSETEPRERWDDGSTAVDWLPIFNASGHGMASIIAESLAAVLPVLDELALEAAGDYFPSADGQSVGFYCRDPRALAMVARNRATLAALGGAQ